MKQKIEVRKFIKKRERVRRGIGQCGTLREKEEEVTAEQNGKIERRWGCWKVEENRREKGKERVRRLRRRKQKRGEEEIQREHEVEEVEKVIA